MLYTTNMRGDRYSDYNQMWINWSSASWFDRCQEVVRMNHLICTDQSNGFLHLHRHEKVSWVPMIGQCMPSCESKRIRYIVIILVSPLPETDRWHSNYCRRGMDVILAMRRIIVESVIIKRRVFNLLSCMITRGTRQLFSARNLMMVPQLRWKNKAVT